MMAQYNSGDKLRKFRNGLGATVALPARIPSPFPRDVSLPSWRTSMLRRRLTARPRSPRFESPVTPGRSALHAVCGLRDAAGLAGRRTRSAAAAVVTIVTVWLR
jgi:hypothetical protein